MDENPQEMEVFISRQMRKRHLAAVWASLAGLEPGMVVADVGCGPGVLAREYAGMVGADGIVYAIGDNAAAPGLLAGLTNVRILFQRCENAMIVEHIPNIIFLTDRLQHVSTPEVILNHAFELCGPQTQVLLTGYDPEAPGLVGMKPHRRMSPATMIALLEAAGFSHGGVIQAPDEHYALLANR